MMPHTQGPWHADDEGGWDVSDEQGNSIASCWEYDVGHKEVDSNMKLIAAAPNMHATLKWLRETLPLSKAQQKRVDEVLKETVSE